MADILLGMESLSNNLRSPKSDPIFARTETPQADSAVAASLSSAPDSSAFISSSVSDSQHFSHQRPFRFIASSTQSSLSSTGFDETVQTAFNGSHSIYSRNLSNTAPSSNLSNPSLWTPFLGSSGYWSTPGAFCLPLGLFFLILPLTLHQHLFITLRPSRILYLLRSPLFFLPTPSPAYSSSPTSHKRQILSGCCRRWLVAACRTLRHRRLHNSFEQHYRPQDPNHDRLPHQSGFEFCQVVYLCLICLGLTGLACIAGWRLRQLPDWLEMLLKTASGTNYLPPDRSFSAQEQLKQAGDGPEALVISSPWRPVPLFMLSSLSSFWAWDLHPPAKETLESLVALLLFCLVGIGVAVRLGTISRQLDDWTARVRREI